MTEHGAFCIQNRWYLSEDAGSALAKQESKKKTKTDLEELHGEEMLHQ